MTVKTVQLAKSINGITNVYNETDIPEGFLRSAINVDTDKSGNISTREGYTKIYSGENCHSLFEGFFAEKTLLKYIDENDNVSVIAGLRAANNFLSYCYVNTDTLFTDGVHVARILQDHTTEFLAPPVPFLPKATQSIGSLSGGAYQYVICNLSEKGTVSGAPLAGTIEISHGNGIIFSNIESGSYSKALFVSNPNGTELHLRAVIDLHATEYTLSNIEYEGYALETQFMEQLPAGQIIRYFKGKVYVADNSTLWFSQPLRYGLYKPSEDFIQFPSRITIVEPVDDGIFIVADKTYFLRGTDTKNITLNDFISEDTAIEGSGLQVTGMDFGLNDSNIAFWVSNKGLVLGLPGGAVKNLTENNIALNTNFKKGASMYREVHGKKQILTTLNGGGDTSTFTSTDTLTSTIIRNGQVVE